MLHRNVSLLVVVLATAALVMLPAFPVPAEEKRAYARSEIVEVAKLTNPELGPEAWFGIMDISGDTIVVGAPWDDYLGLGRAGSASVFVRDADGWKLQQMLIAPDRDPGDEFGGWVAISGDTIAVGAQWAHHSGVYGPGTAYVFTRSNHTWSLEQKIIQSNPQDSGRFGSSIALDGDTLVVGSKEGPPQYAGNVRVFTRSEGVWTEAQILTTDEVEEGHWTYFGNDLALDGDWLAAGAYGNDAVYMYERVSESWEFRQKLTPSDGGRGAFGQWVDLDGDTLIVSSPFQDHSGLVAAGAAYIYSRTGGVWTEQQILISDAPMAWDTFGNGASVSGDYAVVGAGPPHRGDNDPYSAAAYFFRHDDSEWRLVEKITGGDLGCGDIAATADVGGNLATVLACAPITWRSAVSVFDIGNPEHECLVIPAAARVQGKGAFFTSRWDLYNAGYEDLVLELLYTPRNDFDGPQLTGTHTVPAGRLEEILDPLAVLFGITQRAVGSVIVTASSGSIDDLMLQSVVLAQLDDGSEYGQFSRAQTVADAMVQGETGFLTTTEDPLHYRVNIGLMGLEDGTRVELTPAETLQVPIGGPKTFDFDLGENRQINDVYRFFDLGNTPNRVIEIEVLRGKVVAYASIVDGNGDYVGTSDPTIISPVAARPRKITLLEIGSVQGIDEFSGSASLTNLASVDWGDWTVEASFYERGKQGVAATASFPIGGGQTLGYTDIVGDIFGFYGSVGTVVLDVGIWGSIAVNGREFSIFRDGDGEIVGTAGCLISGMTDSDLLQPGNTHHFISLRSIESEMGTERSHVAVFNPGDSPVTLDFTLFGANGGTAEGTLRKEVGGQRLVQFNHILDKINPAQNGEIKRLVVTVSETVYMRAFRANASGDPITLEPFVR